ncbi:hypothetical protein [Hydrogenophaga sp. 2FB]|uniref:hypothetical protein n=1 Tax=Hydrogenophaga sp. 2FB TaxID=2502187 RepID=UPI0010F8694F|nr:hypothetical protein [Hydrogenophaga sp. 2FB]
MGKPTPFTIVRNEGMPPVATNGATRLMCLDADGEVRLRRAIRTVMVAPMAERLIPQLNALSGELLANTMSAEDVAARLHALQLSCTPIEPQHVEWAYVEIAGVRVYTDGTDVIVTRQDLLV